MSLSGYENDLYCLSLESNFSDSTLYSGKRNTGHVIKCIQLKRSLL